MRARAAIMLGSARFEDWGEDKNGGAERLLERIRMRSSGGRGSPTRGVVAGMGVRHGRREL